MVCRGQNAAAKMIAHILGGYRKIALRCRSEAAAPAMGQGGPPDATKSSRNNGGGVPESRAGFAGVGLREAPGRAPGLRAAALAMGDAQQRDSQWGIVEAGAGGVSRAVYGAHTCARRVGVVLASSACGFPVHGCPGLGQCPAADHVCLTPTGGQAAGDDLTRAPGQNVYLPLAGSDESFPRWFA